MFCSRFVPVRKIVAPDDARVLRKAESVDLVARARNVKICIN